MGGFQGDKDQPCELSPEGKLGQREGGVSHAPAA